MTQARTERRTHTPCDTDREHGVMGLAECGLLPDALIRMGIRRLLKQRLREEAVGGDPAVEARTHALLHQLSNGPIAAQTDSANRQHYEVPADFYQLALGHRLKYSGCYYPPGVATLDDAEDAALAQVSERADLADGMHLLELGCGWGSLTLWMAERHPGSRITAVSNSASQRRHILQRAAEHGFDNINVITADINGFDTNLRFDRVVSVEMFEHMANHAELMRRVAGWLRDDGKLFVHVFSHKRFTYRFEVQGQSNWMGRHFFTGGMMPAHGYLPALKRDLCCEQDWWQDGTHYQRTAEHWLMNTDTHPDVILSIFDQTYGPTNSRRWLQRWRIFFMACAELWGYNAGKDWGVSHYLFTKARP